MPTYNQLFKKGRNKNLTGRENRRQAFFFKKNSRQRAPMKKAICIRVYTTSPKKPNSAVRKIAKVLVAGNLKKTLVAIPGFGHNLAPHSHLLIRGCRCRDTPGIQYKAIRGKLDFVSPEAYIRSRRRSKFGLKKLKDD